MKNKIEILSPGKACWKTRKLITRMKYFTDKKNIETEYIILTGLQDFIKYKTWVFPTVIVNGKIVAKGYKSAKIMVKHNNIPLK